MFTSSSLSLSYLVNGETRPFRAMATNPLLDCTQQTRRSTTCTLPRNMLRFELLLQWQRLAPRRRFDESAAAKFATLPIVSLSCCYYGTTETKGRRQPFLLCTQQEDFRGPRADFFYTRNDGQDTAHAVCPHTMASVRQKKKGIRAASGTPPEVSSLPRPHTSSPPPAGLERARERARSPASAAQAPPKAPARTAAVQSARNRGKRSPSATTSSSSSPTHLIGAAPGTRCVAAERGEVFWCQNVFVG